MKRLNCKQTATVALLEYVALYMPWNSHIGSIDCLIVYVHGIYCKTSNVDDGNVEKKFSYFAMFSMLLTVVMLNGGLTSHHPMAVVVSFLTDGKFRIGSAHLPQMWHVFVFLL